jgi:hypothetical protein
MARVLPFPLWTGRSDGQPGPGATGKTKPAPRRATPPSTTVELERRTDTVAPCGEAPSARMARNREGGALCRRMAPAFRCIGHELVALVAPTWPGEAAGSPGCRASSRPSGWSRRLRVGQVRAIPRWRSPSTSGTRPFARGPSLPVRMRDLRATADDRHLQRGDSESPCERLHRVRHISARLYWSSQDREASHVLHFRCGNSL